MAIMHASDSILGAYGKGRGLSNSCFVGTLVQMFLSTCDCLAMDVSSKLSLPYLSDRKLGADEYPIGR